MPPWGKGPVQGKIHSGPSYIEDNFPKLDKFNHCKVQRLGQEKKAEEVGVNILRKGDKVTDEEEFQQARLNSPVKDRLLAQGGGDNGTMAAAYGLLVTGLLLVLVVLLKGRKKVDSKSV